MWWFSQKNYCCSKKTILSPLKIIRFIVSDYGETTRVYMPRWTGGRIDPCSSKATTIFTKTFLLFSLRFQNTYEFGILNENNKNSPNDSKVKATIQCIIEEFFLTNIVQAVKICYKWKIDYRDFKCGFYSFLELRRHSNSSFWASLPCISCPFAWQ